MSFTPMPLTLINTLTRRPEPFRPRDPSRVTFYSCGPTVYDFAHIGNFRSFLAADLLRRWIESPWCELANETPEQRAQRERGGRTVVHVMNITDVGHMTDDAEGGERGEDRMAVAGRRLLEAKKSGTLPADAIADPGDPYQIARYYEGAFKDDARKLGLKVILDADKDPSLNPRATAHVEGMKLVIERLMARGCAYVVGTPGSRVVYFDVQKFPAYGRLSGNTLDQLRSGAGGRVDEGTQASKRHPADFLLWKEDPSHVMKWDSPWGKGYPGWHIECTAMSATGLLGEAAFRGLLASPDASGAIIDLHSGGEDNIFPHHECEIAQSCGAFSRDPGHGTFATLWFHPRFLVVEGEKMSKSKGNFFTARDLFEKDVEPGALRLELIKTHYRSNANFTMQGLQDCQKMIDRWRRVSQATAGRATDRASADRAVMGEFAAALNDDLNIAKAIAAVNSWVGRVTSPTPADAATMLAIDAVLGVLSLAQRQGQTTDIGIFAPGVTPDPAITALLEQRRDARARKDFKASDEIRDRLLAMGLAIKDVAGGKVEVSRR